MTVRVVGLDTSLSDAGVVRFSDLDEMPRLSNAIVDIETPTTEEQELERMRLVAMEVVRLAMIGVEDGDDVLFVFEGPSLHSKHGKPDERAGLRWIVALNLRRHGRFVFVPPATLKLYWTGNGNAPKPVMLAKARERYPNLEIRNHNTADALALAHMGARHRGIIPTLRLPEVYTTQLERVAWPN